MKIFSKRTNPMVQTLDQLTERQTRLTTMRSEVQVTLDTALADRQCHLIGGNVDDQSTAETLQARADTAQSTLLGLDDAIAALTIQIADAEAVISAEHRRIRAEADAKQLTAVIAGVEKLLPAWIATARELSELLGSLNNFRYQVGGVSNYLGGVANQTEAGLRVVLDDLSGAVDAVARGEQTVRIGNAESSPTVATSMSVAADIFKYSAPKHGPTYRGC